MRFPRILFFYLLTEVVFYTVVGFFIFAMILVSQNFLRTLANAEGGIPNAPEMLSVLVRLIFIFAAYAVPIAFLFGVLLAMGRISSDSEVTAMRACGLGLGTIVSPVLVVAVFISMATGYMMIEVEPLARQDLRRVLQTLASEIGVIEPGTFHSVASRVIFARSRDEDDRLHGVVVWDESDANRPFTVFAEFGRASFDSVTEKFQLHLENGAVHLEPLKADVLDYRRITFATFDYEIDLAPLIAVSVAQRRPREMTMEEIHAVLDRARRGEALDDLRDKDPLEYERQLHRRYALPFAPFVFALVGVPLGLRKSRGARSWGALACVALAFVYYLLLSFGKILTSEGLPPSVALWLPNLMFAALAIPLLRRASRGVG